MVWQLTAQTSLLDKVILIIVHKFDYYAHTQSQEIKFVFATTIK